MQEPERCWVWEDARPTEYEKQTEFNQSKIMDKKPISISFANQKGGIGKSTLTILAASWLRYVRGLNVLVVDCDFPQNSIVELREREKKAVMKNDAYKLMLQRQFERLQKKA